MGKEAEIAKIILSMDYSEFVEFVETVNAWISEQPETMRTQIYNWARAAGDNP